MKTTNQQLQTFSRLSGDYTPVYIDTEYAHRTMFGGQIVYGVCQVMLCLREAVREMWHPVLLTTCKAEFRRALIADLLSVPAAAAEDILFPEMLKFEENSLYD